MNREGMTLNAFLNEIVTEMDIYDKGSRIRDTRYKVESVELEVFVVMLADDTGGHNVNIITENTEERKLQPHKIKIVLSVIDHYGSSPSISGQERDSDWGGPRDD